MCSQSENIELVASTNTTERKQILKFAVKRLQPQANLVLKKSAYSDNTVV